MKEGDLVSKVSKKKGKKMSSTEREELLIENFVSLQKVMTNLSIKFENLSDNINKLLTIFELSAKDYMINKGRMNPGTDREVLNQLNNLIEQNKSLSRSVSSMEEKLKNRPVQENFKFSSQPQATTNSSPSNIPAGYESSIQNTQSSQKQQKPYPGI